MTKKYNKKKIGLLVTAGIVIISTVLVLWVTNAFDNMTSTHSGFATATIAVIAKSLGNKGFNMKLQYDSGDAYGINDV